MFNKTTFFKQTSSDESENTSVAKSSINEDGAPNVAPKIAVAQLVSSLEETLSSLVTTTTKGLIPALEKNPETPVSYKENYIQITKKIVDCQQQLNEFKDDIQSAQDVVRQKNR